MDHPLTGFLVYTIQQIKIGWMNRRMGIEDDFKQECNLFLLEWSQNHPETLSGEMSPEVKNEFRRCFWAKVSYFARVSGFKQVRGSRHFKKMFEMLTEEIPVVGEDPRKVIFLNSWIEEKLNISQKAILSTGNGSSKLDWFGFRSYVFGNSACEISFLIGWKPGEVGERLTDCVKRVRQQVGIDENAPMPPMPTMRGAARFGRNKHQVGLNENPGKRRIKIDITGLSVSELQKQFGIPRSTAYRIKARGWYTRDYHKKSDKTDKSQSKKGE